MIEDRDPPPVSRQASCVSKEHARGGFDGAVGSCRGPVVRERVPPVVIGFKALGAWNMSPATREKFPDGTDAHGAADWCCATEVRGSASSSISSNG
jgi:hypothetical protein